jgi:hypothetical protein
MDGDDFQIRDERDDCERDDCPTSGVEAEQGGERGEQAQAVKFCEIRMCGRIFSEADVTDDDAGGFGKKDERDQNPVLREDGLAQPPHDGEDEQVINHVRDAVVAAERGPGHAETPREDAVINIRKRGGDEDGQINPARNIRQRASQGDWAEQQPQGGEREWKVAFQFRNLMTQKYPNWC